MATKTRTARSLLPDSIIFATIPGPTRKRTRTPYCYRLTHRAADSREAGCVMQWEVFGGREIYQIDLERLPSGDLHWHCTCADAVYRGENRRHFCKHVRGLLEQGRRPVLEAEPVAG